MASNILRMKYPARIADGLWKEALPVGNGKTGAMLLGAAGEDYLWVNRYDRWDGSDEGVVIPDVSGVISEMRELQKEGRFPDANALLTNALNEKGYSGPVAVPSEPAHIRFLYESNFPFRDYERGVDTSTGEAYVSFTQNGLKQKRKAFVSRNSDNVYFKATAGYGMNVKIFASKTAGFSVKVILNSEGTCTDYGDYTEITDCTEFTVICAFTPFAGSESYTGEFRKHKPLHKAAMGNASLDLGSANCYSDVLLDDVYSGKETTALFEKYWQMGRYTFACGTAPDGYPFPLYGLWHGVAGPVWAQNVANENVQMIYWHTLTGGYAELIKPLIHYYYGMMDICREAAKKMFGTRGIFVSVYTTPTTRFPAPNVPVIVNFIGVAGWLSRIFYDNYLYTGDRELLESEILPFMLEAAAFYEDYAYTDDNGKIVLAPTVSPENTPANLMPEFTGRKAMAHPCPAVVNSTIEIAIMKELFCHLLEINEDIPLDASRVSRWREILASVPEYMVNDDGAVREWQDVRLDDNYHHRHLSHIYPLFPGEEVRKGDPLFGAFEKAVDLRVLGSQSGWSLAHMASIYDRLGRGDRAAECLDTLARSCTLGNFFTQHNDWRNMGLSLNAQEGKTIQLDALMGAVNAIQEMLLRTDRDAVYILPALPSLFKKGKFENWHIPGGLVNCEWNTDTKKLSVTLTAERDITVKFIFADEFGIEPAAVTCMAGETTVIV